MPKRIQLSRKKGWRKPEGAIVVARPSKWGNPFKVGGAITRQRAVDDFRVHAIGVGVLRVERIRAELAGHDLACWCPEGQPCHADVLLELANGPA